MMKKQEEKTLEALEAFQSKYDNHFRREAEKTTMFRQMNLKKPTKCFLNLASDQRTMDNGHCQPISLYSGPRGPITEDSTR